MVRLNITAEGASEEIFVEEMLRPHLLARMKQRDFVFRDGIEPGLKRALETVASQTRKCKIRLVRSPATRFRDNMLDRERIGVKAA